MGNICRVQGPVGTHRPALSVPCEVSPGEQVVRFLAFLTDFGLGRLAMIAGVTGGVAIALIVIMVRIGTEPLQVLYADLDYSSAQTVISELDQAGEDYEMREVGTRVSILVPRDRVSRLRLPHAGRGLIGSTEVGYEIFDGQQPLGTTSFQQNLNRVRALEGELARTVSSIAGVRSARVHLVLPERSLFSRERQQATAAIMVEASRTLDARTVTAITNMVASAVPELTANRITVLDINGNLLAAARDETSDAATDTMISDRMAAAEARLQSTVSELLGRIVGPENVRARLAADFDVSRVTETAEIVDPDSQVVLSSTVIEETADDISPQRGVSVSSALPNAAANSNAPSSSQTRRTEEITNYEITKTVRNAVRDEGLVLNRLTVAVAINNRGDDGTVTPLTPDAINRLEALVKSAVGFDPSRGDQIDIVDLPFTPLEESTPSSAAAPAESTLVSRLVSLRLAEVVALAMVAFGLIYFVLRPLFLSAGTASANASLSGSSATTGSIASAHPATQPDNLSLRAPEPRNRDLEQRINIAQVEGQVRASSIKQVQEIVKGHTDESALILKQWIRESV